MMRRKYFDLIILSMLLFSMAFWATALAGDGFQPAPDEGVICDMAGFKSTCSIGCPYGYLYDQVGCPTCECQDLSEAFRGACEIPTCPEICEVGYVPDGDGCLTCACGDPDAVPEESVICDLAGFRQRCEIGCPYGYEYMQDGCPTCYCQESSEALRRGCEIPVCPEICSAGYVPNRAGCLTCTCGDPDIVPEESVICDLAGFRQRCEIGCPYGYLFSQDGCPTCQCQDQPEVLRRGCEIPTCPEICEVGYVPDRDGCLTCICG